MIKTTSLETSRKLKEAGFRQDTFFSYALWDDGTVQLLCRKQNEWGWDENRHKIAAPTSDEILAELPENMVRVTKWMGVWIAETYEGSPDCRCEIRKANESLPEALAQMWLYLKKEGLL